MKKTIIVFGLIAGLIISTFMAVTIGFCYDDANFEGSELIGYSAMVVAFIFIFVGIKNYRDKHNNGVVTFGKAFKTGFFIALIASTMYVATWLVEYYVFIPDFMDKYTEYVIKEAKADGKPQAELDKQMAQMETYKVMYKNPLMVVLLTYMEILPLGLVIALISALILKRKTKKEDIAPTG